MDMKSIILARVRDAISRFQTRPAGPIPYNYIRSGESPSDSKPVIDEMIEKLEDYSAEVIVTPKDAVILDVTDRLLGEARSAVVPAGLPGDYKKAAARGSRTVVENSHKEVIATLDLNEIDTVLTCSRAGISISGTIILDDEPDQGRRAISLVPDKHIAVLERETIMPTVPQAVDVLEEHPTRPATRIAGGSATSDIELVRVSDVYGPRNLRVAVTY